MSQSSIHKMQRYIFGSVVLMSAIAVSFPIAMARVSATKEFPGQAVKSQDCAAQTLKESKVIEWAKDCAPLKIEPKKAEAKPNALPSVAIVPSPVSPSPVSPSPAATQPTATDSIAVPKPELKPTQPPSLPSLQLGSSGSSVNVLQEQLQLAGVFSGTVDGVFGTETELAVQTLQQRLKLEPNGIADTTVQTALKSETIDNAIDR